MFLLLLKDEIPYALEWKWYEQRVLLMQKGSKETDGGGEEDGRGGGEVGDVGLFKIANFVPSNKYILRTIQIM